MPRWVSAPVAVAAPPAVAEAQVLETKPVCAKSNEHKGSKWQSVSVTTSKLVTQGGFGGKREHVAHSLLLPDG